MPSNTHQTYSYGAAASGDMHQFTTFRGLSRVSLHPLQRSGQVSAASHRMIGAQGAMPTQGIGDAMYAWTPKQPVGPQPLPVPMSTSFDQNRFNV